ncbi:hypothetical protein HanPI659440_Chr13g0499751 [Helianthus annuus]|nr:hypothetical protein HanPI659440_Chr13g0499751 [Helianthus annuus]
MSYAMQMRVKWVFFILQSIMVFCHYVKFVATSSTDTNSLQTKKSPKVLLRGPYYSIQNLMLMKFGEY